MISVEIDRRGQTLAAVGGGEVGEGARCDKWINPVDTVIQAVESTTPNTSATLKEQPHFLKILLGEELLRNPVVYPACVAPMHANVVIGIDLQQKNPLMRQYCCTDFGSRAQRSASRWRSKLDSMWGLPARLVEAEITNSQTVARHEPCLSHHDG